ncbi:hypothetical protein V1282_006908 [Nitrobacteraceae bacterium AZCC 2146]
MLDWTGASGFVALVWLACHFLIYVAVLRNMPLFQTERGIFLYHLTSTAIFVGAALLIFLIRRDSEAFAVACALVAGHGIYSISFLELWSLAQGSYSLSIMGQGRSDKAPSRAELVDSFSRIGNAKKADRLSGLQGSNLIRLDGNHWKLNGSGATVASVLRRLLWLANIKERG